MTNIASRYVAAEAFTPARLRELVDSAAVKPTWLRGTESFWYRRLHEGKTEFVMVDAEAGTKQPAFDHTRMAEALKGVLDGEVDPGELPITKMDLANGGLRLEARGQRVEVRLDSYTVTALGPVLPHEDVSPDGRWALFTQDYNLFVRDTSTDEVRQLTTDGEADFGYGDLADFAVASVKALGVGLPPFGVWSPDGNRWVTAKFDQRAVGMMHIVKSAPAGGGRPVLQSYHYACVGDAEESLATSEYHVFDLPSGSSVKADCGPVLTPFLPVTAYGYVWWSDDSRTVSFISTSRGDTEVKLNTLDATSGQVRVALEESSTSQILFGPQQQDCNVRTLTSGEVLWWSQRTDWGHLYLYGTDGSVTALTSGEWMVRNVVSVDEDARRVVFTAAGRLPGQDPYLQEVCSVALDGGDITTVTSDGLDHDVVASPSGRFLVDVISRYDTPTVSVLRDATGAELQVLERANAARLLAAGWTPPERAVVKAADGVTDIYCSVYRPHGFDPTQKYPVLDGIYPGPQVSSATLRFPQSGGVMVGFTEGPVFAALGFVVVEIDGRGSALRSKSFQDYARRSGEAVFVDDHAVAIKQLAETRPWMDLDRVGITGHSAGGYGAARALLARPDLFSVAVSSCGNHDNTVNHAWWGEKFFGSSESFDFNEQSNASLAGNLQGKLFLIHGDADDNAVPHGTMRLVDALIRANKDFDLLIVPNAGHAGVLLNGYWVRKRWDYLVQHLMGETPPDGYQVADTPLPF